MNIINHKVTHSLSCHLPCMLKVVQVHQLVELASIVVARKGALHTTHNYVAVLIRIGIGLTELIEIVKITPFKLYMYNIQNVYIKSNIFTHACTCI